VDSLGLADRLAGGAVGRPGDPVRLVPTVQGADGGHLLTVPLGELATDAGRAPQGVQAFEPQGGSPDKVRGADGRLAEIGVTGLQAGLAFFPVALTNPAHRPTGQPQFATDRIVAMPFHSHGDDLLAAQQTDCLTHRR